VPPVETMVAVRRFDHGLRRVFGDRGPERSRQLLLEVQHLGHFAPRPERALLLGPKTALLPSGLEGSIIRRMINKLALLITAAVALAGVGCEPKPRHPGALQGVIEFDERVLGFEVGGRVTSIKVVRGSTVRA